MLTHGHTLDLIVPWASSFSSIINSAFLSYRSLLVFYSLIPVALFLRLLLASLLFWASLPGSVVLTLCCMLYPPTGNSSEESYSRETCLILVN